MLLLRGQALPSRFIFYSILFWSGNIAAFLWRSLLNPFEIPTRFHSRRESARKCHESTFDCREFRSNFHSSNFSFKSFRPHRRKKSIDPRNNKVCFTYYLLMFIIRCFRYPQQGSSLPFRITQLESGSA